MKWIQSWAAEGRGEFRIGRSEDELIAEWVGVATLTTDRSGAHHDFHVHANVDAAIAEKYRVNLVRALLGHLDGELTLHAGTFAISGNAIACLGTGGAGKSTLVARACEREGVHLVGDDTAPIDLRPPHPEVAPTGPLTWLLPGARNDPTSTRKVAIPATRSTTSPVRLRAIISLAWSDAATPPRLTRLRGRHAFEPVSLAQIRFVLDEPEVQTRDFDQIASLLSRIPVFILERPRDLALIDRAVDLLVALLQQKEVEP